jgi:hypothetical protein
MGKGRKKRIIAKTTRIGGRLRKRKSHLKRKDYSWKFVDIIVQCNAEDAAAFFERIRCRLF